MDHLNYCKDSIFEYYFNKNNGDRNETTSVEEYLIKSRPYLKI